MDNVDIQIRGRIRNTTLQGILHATLHFQLSKHRFIKKWWLILKMNTWFRYSDIFFKMRIFNHHMMQNGNMALESNGETVLF